MFHFDFNCFREKKELEISQVRQNIEDSKRLGSEKNIRNKSDLDRRVRELKSNNTKKFVEERKRQTMKHEREKENLVQSHETQKTTPTLVRCVSTSNTCVPRHI